MSFTGILSIFTSLIYPIISILTGLLFLKARDIIQIIKGTEFTKQDQFRMESIIKISNLIGILTIVYASIRLLSRLIDLPRNIMHLF